MDPKIPSTVNSPKTLFNIIVVYLSVIVGSVIGFFFSIYLASLVSPVVGSLTKGSGEIVLSILYGAILFLVSLAICVWIFRNLISIMRSESKKDKSLSLVMQRHILKFLCFGFFGGICAQEAMYTITSIYLLKIFS